MIDYPKITIVTPSFNQGQYIEETILSVIGQNYPNLEYIIIDGGSTDNSIEIIKKYEEYLTYWVSEPDGGMYEAIQKGFDKSTGEIMGWINSDDMLHRKSLFTLSEIFSSFPNIMWLHGLNTVFDEQGRTVSTQQTRLISKYNFYLREHHLYGFLQQESTFWRAKLWQESGSCFNKELKLAGDFDLWMRFFRLTNLYTTSALIGGFRVRKLGQLSVENLQEYLDEVSLILLNEDKLLTAKQRRNIRFIKLYQKYFQRIPIIRSKFHRKYLDSFELAPEKISFNSSLQIFELV